MIERLELERAKWTAIADPVGPVCNERLKEKDISPGPWSVGENKIERLLGKELCVLAWAAEDAPLDLVAVAITNWSGLKPEERWWLFTMTAAATGGVEDGDVGWRKALRFALTENPVQAGALPQRRTKKARHPSLSLFGDPQGHLGLTVGRQRSAVRAVPVCSRRGPRSTTARCGCSWTCAASNALSMTGRNRGSPSKRKRS